MVACEKAPAIAVTHQPRKVAGGEKGFDEKILGWGERLSQYLPPKPEEPCLIPPKKHAKKV